MSDKSYDLTTRNIQHCQHITADNKPRTKSRSKVTYESERLKLARKKKTRGNKEKANRI